MTDTSKPQFHSEKTENKAEQVVSYLRLQPYDLSDVRRVMRRFHASAEDLQQAIDRLDRPPQD